MSDNRPVSALALLHRALAASAALVERSAGVMVFNLAFPPLRPSATAAGSFLLGMLTSYQAVSI